MTQKGFKVSHRWRHRLSNVSTRIYKLQTCKCKIQQIDNVVGQCPKCDILTKCPKTSTAKVIVSRQDGKDEILTLFDPVLSQIVDGISAPSLAMKLLCAPKHKFFFDERGIVFTAKKV